MIDTNRYIYVDRKQADSVDLPHVVKNQEKNKQFNASKERNEWMKNGNHYINKIRNVIQRLKE